MGIHLSERYTENLLNEEERKKNVEAYNVKFSRNNKLLYDSLFPVPLS